MTTNACQSRINASKIAAEAFLQPNAPAPRPSLFLVDLNNHSRTPLVHVQWGSLSSIEQRLVYADPNHRLRILELATGRILPPHARSSRLNSLFVAGWKTNCLCASHRVRAEFVPHHPGWQQPAPTDRLERHLILCGWKPDGRQVPFTKGATLQALDVQSGKGNQSSSGFAGI